MKENISKPLDSPPERIALHPGASNRLKLENKQMGA